jgi:hypothetical protein
MPLLNAAASNHNICCRYAVAAAFRARNHSFIVLYLRPRLVVTWDLIFLATSSLSLPAMANFIGFILYLDGTLRKTNFGLRSCVSSCLLTALTTRRRSVMGGTAASADPTPAPGNDRDWKPGMFSMLLVVVEDGGSEEDTIVIGGGGSGGLVFLLLCRGLGGWCGDLTRSGGGGGGGGGFAVATVIGAVVVGGGTVVFRRRDELASSTL